MFLHSVGSIRDLSSNSTEKDCLSLPLYDDFHENVAQQTNKCASHCQKHRPDSKWDDTNAKEIQAEISVSLYMGLITVPEICHYIQEEAVVCPTVKQTMTLQ
jgi:hypothetical protein